MKPLRFLSDENNGVYPYREGAFMLYGDHLKRINDYKKTVSRLVHDLRNEKMVAEYWENKAKKQSAAANLSKLSDSPNIIKLKDKYFNDEEKAMFNEELSAFIEGGGVFKL